MSALLAGIPTTGSRFAAGDFLRAAGFHGFAAQVVRRKLAKISPLPLPATLLLKDGNACVLTRFVTNDSVEVVVPESGFGAREMPLADLETDYSGYAIFAQPALEAEKSREDEGVPTRQRG